MEVVEVKYNNELNLLSFVETRSGKAVNLTTHQNRIIQLILSFAQKEHDNYNKKNILEKFFNKETRTIEIEFAKFFQLIDNNKWEIMPSKVGVIVDELLKKILHSTLTYEDEDRKVMFVCFEKAEYIKHEQIVRVTFQKDFYDMVTNYENGFTLFELQEFFALKSSYSQTLYRLLKQFRKTGKLLLFKDRWEQFCKIMNIPESYKMGDINTRVLNPAIAELTKQHTLFDQERIMFKDLKYEKIKIRTRGQGGKVVGIVFTFEPETEARIEFDEAQKPEVKPQNKINTEAMKERLEAYINTNIYLNELNYKIEAITLKTYDDKVIITISIRDEEKRATSVQFNSEQDFIDWYNAHKI